MILSPAGHQVDLARQPRIDITLSLSLTSNQTDGQNITPRTGEADNISNSSSSPPARPRDIIGRRIILSRDQAELKLEDNLRQMGGGQQEEIDRGQISQSELYKNIFMSVMSVSAQKKSEEN